MIAADIAGPWVIDNTQPHWGIINQLTGRRKAIGPAGYKPGRKNYFDVANEEASRRNHKLLNGEKS